MSIFDRDETPVRVSFTLPRYMLDNLDEYAEVANLSRSRALRVLLHGVFNELDLDDVRLFTQDKTK